MSDNDNDADQFAPLPTNEDFIRVLEAVFKPRDSGRPERLIVRSFPITMLEEVASDELLYRNSRLTL